LRQPQVALRCVLGSRSCGSGLGVFTQSTNMTVMRCSRRWLALNQIRADVAADLPCSRRCSNLAPRPLPVAGQEPTAFILVVALTVLVSRVSDARVMWTAVLRASHE
jgi:hypothetical protein